MCFKQILNRFKLKIQYPYKIDENLKKKMFDTSIRQMKIDLTKLRAKILQFYHLLHIILELETIKRFIQYPVEM